MCKPKLRDQLLKKLLIHYSHVMVIGDFQPRSSLNINQSLNPVILGITFDSSLNFKFQFAKIVATQI